MLMPLNPMHVALAVGTTPASAAATNPDANPDATAARRTPLANLSFATLWCLDMGAGPPNADSR